jgi:hypothetical protein
MRGRGDEDYLRLKRLGIVMGLEVDARVDTRATLKSGGKRAQKDILA